MKWDHYLLLIVVLNVYLCHRCFHRVCKVKSLKDKKGKTVLNGFVEIVNESKRKPNKLWVWVGRSRRAIL